MTIIYTATRPSSDIPFFIETLAANQKAEAEALSTASVLSDDKLSWISTTNDESIELLAVAASKFHAKYPTFKIDRDTYNETHKIVRTTETK
jgi:hypothetical protein